MHPRGHPDQKISGIRMIDFKTYQPDGIDDVLVLQLLGQLDGDTSDYLIKCVQEHLDDGARKIILDCDCLDFATSLGLGTLVRAAMRVNRESGEVVLCNVRGILAELVQVSQLGRLMHIYPDVDDAAKKLTGS